MYSTRYTGLPVKVKVTADSVITTTPIAFMFTTYYLFSMFY